MKEEMLPIHINTSEGAPYSTAIKELVETLILLQEKTPTKLGEGVKSGVSVLLLNEIEIQRRLQADILAEYNKEDKKKTKPTVVPIK